VLVKLLFFPLANKSYASMAKMKAVQPEMAAIRERKTSLDLVAHSAGEPVSTSPDCAPWRRQDEAANRGSDSSRMRMRQRPVRMHRY